MPIKADTIGRVYYEGDNITITARDLAWIKTPPKTPHPSESERLKPARLLRRMLGGPGEQLMARPVGSGVTAEHVVAAT